MSDSATGRTLVIGCGNLLGADDGVGLAALERLRHWRLPQEVQLEDGGTWGLNLLPLIESAERLLILDAIDARAAPGTLLVLENDEIPKLFSTKLSPHQIDLREVLALAELRGTLPSETVAIGLQPERVEMSTVLSPAVKAGLDDLELAVAEQLARWGHAVDPAAEVASA
jgi:hydrogenase maturation protease